MSARVVVLDYGSGNVHSAVRMLERVGAEVELTADPAAVLAADGLAGARAWATSTPACGGCARSAVPGWWSSGWPAAGRCWASASGCR